MTSQTRPWARWCPTGSTILSITAAGSAWASTITAEFAVNASRTWHERIGSVRYRGSDRLLITADCGGSNGARVRLWKVELQKLADETGLTISVCHYPPGTSKWNTIEHRLFCHITQTWRGRPLISRGRRGSDCRDHDDERADSGLRAGPAALCEGDQD